MERHPNILNAASNLLGICFIIIAGLRLTESNSRSFADEIAWVAAICFLISILLSYLAIRKRRDEHWQSVWADRIFLAGTVALTLSTCVLAFALN